MMELDEEYFYNEFMESTSSDDDSNDETTMMMMIVVLEEIEQGEECLLNFKGSTPRRRVFNLLQARGLVVSTPIIFNPALFHEGFFAFGSASHCSCALWRVCMPTKAWLL